MEPIQTLSLIGSHVSVASDYHKKKNVIRLALSSGSEYLIQAKSANDMSLWIQNIRGCTVDPNNAEETLIKTLSFSSPSRPVSSVINNEGSPVITAPDHGSKGSKDRSKKTKSLFGKKRKSKGDKIESP